MIAALFTRSSPLLAFCEPSTPRRGPKTKIAKKKGEGVGLSTSKRLAAACLRTQAKPPHYTTRNPLQLKKQWRGVIYLQYYDIDIRTLLYLPHACKNPLPLGTVSAALHHARSFVGFPRSRFKSTTRTRVFCFCSTRTIGTNKTLQQKKSKKKTKPRERFSSVPGAPDKIRV